MPQSYTPESVLSSFLLGGLYTALADTSELATVVAASGPALLLLPPLRKYRKTLALPQQTVHSARHLALMVVKADENICRDYPQLLH